MKNLPGAWAALLLAAGVMNAHAQPGPAADPKQCDKPLLSAIVIDDLLRTPVWMQDRMRAFRLPSVAQAAAPVLQADGCITVLDSDPIFASVPGAAQPEAILRVRADELKAAELALGEKADTAVRRYIAGYLGGYEEEVAVLRSVRVHLQVVCPKQRTVVREFSAESGTEGGKAERNADQLSNAFGIVHGELINSLRKEPKPCGE